MYAENPEVRAQYAQLPDIVCYNDTSTWDIPWKLNLTPWNKWAYNPTLREAIEDPVVEYPKGRDKRALVPGCGEGHDVIYIASSLGISTTGLDLSPTAIERASSLLKATPDAPKDLINLKVEDFFSLKPEREADRYDLIQDYTLFISIHPSQRLEWGRQMAALTKQGGYLITVVFPIDPKTDTGPPCGGQGIHEVAARMARGQTAFVSVAKALIMHVDVFGSNANVLVKAKWA